MNPSVKLPIESSDEKPFCALDEPRAVPFERIFLDPNNPRIAPENPPGYDAPDELFDENRQLDLEKRVARAYDVDTLENAILTQGWVPIDPILVWEHPSKKGYYVVVEGNTRTVALRRLRSERLQRERGKLERIEKKPKTPKEEINEQHRIVTRLQTIEKATSRITVYPVLAKDVEELQNKLPVLLGVRHITHAQQWTPFATNLYILSLYDRMFRLRHGSETPLRIEQDIVKAVGKIVSLGETKTRRNIQAASAFSAFKNEYEDQLPAGEEFGDDDQYYFELILQNRFAHEQFEFHKDALKLEKQFADVLFQWAFSKPRPSGGEDKNENVFYKAENIRLWSQIKNFDDENDTDFAKRLDVNHPEQAQPMRNIESDFLQRKLTRTPIDTFSGLITALRKLDTDTLVSQAAHLEPLLTEAMTLIDQRLKMMRAIKV